MTCDESPVTQWVFAIALNLNHIGQIALPVLDVDRAEMFYENVIGLRKLYRFGDLSFFDCARTRLLLDKTKAADFRPQGCIYFRCADISLTVTSARLTFPRHFKVLINLSKNAVSAL